jgi:hypothetical protein
VILQRQRSTRSAGLLSLETNQENLEEAKATFEQLRETFSLKRKAAAAAIRILEIQRDRTRETTAEKALKEIENSPEHTQLAGKQHPMFQQSWIEFYEVLEY